ncbi:tRNA lysidine(34) synthetase TilS [Smaragdicoccus niigatensis]|uniref:tRNA lysidine(34) synthetase TilS n=1 Tax=Smaragdicoccus niigatensis TaxID=359359 RepID=UPI00036DA17E|nr:tRNA lysidine(34) synthetase TilS [Smaragdicoccus niigatensis]
MDQARSGLSRLPETRAILAIRQAVRSWISRYAPIGTVCVGVSGGADSLALLAGAVAEAQVVRALIVDHQLQDGSDEVARLAAKAARELGATPEILSVQVGRDGGLEAAARDARYAALESARDGSPVLLGHTLDDQAETVLLGLARGSGPRSIWGMREFDDPWGRPLLAIKRETTRAACADLGLEPHVDPHNFSPEFTRVRIRQDVLPLLEDVLGGGVSEALARTADQLRDDGYVLDELAAALQREAARPAGLDTATLLPQPAALRRRVIRSWLLDSGARAVNDVQVRAIDRLVTDWRGQGGVAVPGVSGAPGSQNGGTTGARLVATRKHGTLTLGSDQL